MRAFAAVVLLAVPVFFAACAAGISREELLKEMQERHAPVIVDVRSEGEYDRDHIPGAVHIPFTSIGPVLKGMQTPSGERIAIYCEHGPRAVVATWSLYFAGYRNVYSLEGHMKAWRESQFPIELISH